MSGIKKTVATLKKHLPDDAAQAFFLYDPGPPPHIEFARGKINPTGDGAATGVATRKGNTVFLVPKSARSLKPQAIKELNRAVRTKLDGVVFELGDAAPTAAAADGGATEVPEEMPATTSTAATSGGGNPDVARVMQRIASQSGDLLSRTDLPPVLAKIQSALRRAEATSTGDPRQLATAFQKLRSAVMTYDAERDAAQNASTSTYGNIPQGQDIDADDLPPLPATPPEATGAYGNIPGGPDTTAQDHGPLPPTPDEDTSNYGDLLVGQGISATGYDDTYQDLELVPKPKDDTPPPPAAAADDAADNGPYGRVTPEQMEEHRRQNAEMLAELEDALTDTVVATLHKLDGKLGGTEYARDTAKYARVQQGVLRFREIAEGVDPDLGHLRHILRELRKELVAMIKAVKAKSAR